MTICLSMIVKNEAHCIEKCLKSVLPFIDYWIICDTGSTDETEKIVKNTLKDIPGQFHHNVWVDFSTNRNIALDLAQDKADYILFIDADDYLVVENKSCFKNLTYPVYSINIHQQNNIYHRPSLVSSKIQSKYIGVLHEYLDCPNNPKLLENCYIQFGGTGARSKDPMKYAKDAFILEEALQKEPDNFRYVYYCAQSYRDAASQTNDLNKKKEYYTKAANYFQQRSQMNVGWIEEQAHAALELGKILEILTPNQIVNILNCYIMCYNLVPTRVEPIVATCALLRKNKMFQLSYFYAKIGIKITKPKTGLFLNNDDYDWLIKDELAVSAYYIGNFQESLKINTEILKTVKNLTTQNIDRINKNISYCMEKLS